MSVLFCCSRTSGHLMCLLGFLPVAFAWLRTRHQSAPVHLPESEEESILRKPAAQQLRGWRIFLFWLPAACDLTGTTVRLTSSHLKRRH